MVSFTCSRDSKSLPITTALLSACPLLLGVPYPAATAWCRTAVAQLLRPQCKGAAPAAIAKAKMSQKAGDLVPPLSQHPGLVCYLPAPNDTTVCLCG